MDWKQLLAYITGSVDQELLLHRPALPPGVDVVVDALMPLRGILKLGEGTQASRIYARLERVIPAETVNNLSRRGIIELESSS